MKSLIYGIVLAFLVLLSGSMLLLYYFQPFNEDFNFKNSVNYDDINLQKGNDYQNVEVLNSATANIGSLDLENNGYFKKVYYLPTLIGCIDFDKSSAFATQNQFQIIYNANGQQLYQGQKIEIDVGKTEKISLTAQYSPYGIPFSSFSTQDIMNVSIYLIENKEENPIGVDYSGRNYNYLYQNCDSLKANEKPVAVIDIE